MIPASGQDPSPGRSSSPEPWLRGPVPEVPALLQPVAHALVHAVEDVTRTVTALEAATVWRRPGGAASVGFHVRHAGGSLDRLFTYARRGAVGRTACRTEGRGRAR